MASSWRRNRSIKNHSRALRTLARYSALFVQRRVATGSGLRACIWLAVRRAFELAVTIACPLRPCGSFRGCSYAPSEDSDCKIIVRIDQSLIRTAVSQNCISCDCLQAVNAASSGRLSTTRAIREQKKDNTQLAHTTNKTERRQWAAEVTSSASPAARTACSVRAAASQVLFTNSTPATTRARRIRTATPSSRHRIDGVHSMIQLLRDAPQI